MEKYIYERLQQKPKLRAFVRKNPGWYRHLSRDPQNFELLEKEVKQIRRSAIPGRIEKFGNELGMIKLLMDLAFMDKTS